MEFLFSALAESIFQILFELIGLFFDGLFSLPYASKGEAKAFLKVCFYILLGIFLGWFSFVLYPHTMNGVTPNFAMSLVVIPLIVAAMTTGISRLIEQKTNIDKSLAQFFYSFIFAVAFSITRYSFLVSSLIT